ncbi:hypothetical protein R4575_18060 [Acinetobacter baumannii]|nr:hypothetical protein [Acinetobacter baumannii]
METTTNVNNSSKMQDIFCPKKITPLCTIPLNYQEFRFFRCTMCGQDIDQKIESIIDHNMLCTGY